MSESCFNLYGCEWTAGYLWRSMDYLVRADIIVLACMLGYTLVIVCRFSLDSAARARATNLLYHTGSARRQVFGNRRIAISNLKSIASVAPLLGEAGTCLGILNALSGTAMEKHAFLAFISSRIAVQLIPSAAGILVTVPAIWSHNYMVQGNERSEIALGAKYFRAAPKFAITNRFSELPAFALLAGVVLIIAALAFTINAFPYISVGLPIRVLSQGEQRRRKHLVIAIARRRASDSIPVSVNGNTIPVNKLSDIVRAQLKISPRAVTFVSAEDNVPWADVADVIDRLQGLGSDVVLMKRLGPRVNSRLFHPTL